MLKTFNEVDKAEIRSLELKYDFQYTVPARVPPSLEASPTEYSNFEVGYFLEAAALTLRQSKIENVRTNQLIQVFGMPNVPAGPNQEYERSFKIKGFMAIFRAR